MKYVLLVAAISLAACSDPMSTGSTALRGSWAETEALQPQGSMTRTLSFDTDGTFSWLVETYRSGDQLGVRSSYTEIFGDFTADNGHIDFRPKYSETWDISDRTTDPVIGPAPHTLFDDCTFEVRGDVLTLHYTTYPADGPVPTTLEFRRR